MALGFGMNYGGGNLRGGPRPAGARAAMQSAMRGAGDAAEDARRAAGRSAAGQGGGDPYRGMMPGGGLENPPSHEEGDKPGKVGGGSMGLSPDLSEYERETKAFHEKRNRRSWVAAGFPGVRDRWDSEDRMELIRLEGLKEKAYREAMEAKNAVTYDDTGRVTESGQIIRRRRSDGYEEPWSVKRKVQVAGQEGEVGPYINEADRPYREVMREEVREEPVFDPRFPERRLIGSQQKDHDTRLADNEALKSVRDAEEARALATLTAEQAKELERLRSGNSTSLARVHGEEARKTNEHAVEVGAKGRTDPYDTPAGARLSAEAAQREALRRARIARLEDVADAPEEKQKAYFDALDEIKKAATEANGASRRNLGGRKLGPVSGGGAPAGGQKKAPPVGTKRTVDGVTYVYKGGDPGDSKNWPPEKK